jgi:hypothetical protein
VDSPDGSSGKYIIQVYRPSGKCRVKSFSLKKNLTKKYISKIASDASLKEIKFSAGTLFPDFSFQETDYILLLGNFYPFDPSNIPKIISFKRTTIIGY